jgi:hypothetical protein
MGHVKDRWITKDKTPSDRYGKGLRWQIWYQVGGREKCGGSFRTKDVAERKLVQIEAGLLRGEWVDPTDQTTVVEYARRYFATRPHNARTARQMRSMTDQRFWRRPHSLGWSRSPGACSARRCWIA